MVSKRKRLKRTAKGLGTLIEVSGVDIAHQKRLIELLGSDAVKIYKQFNFQFADNIADDVGKNFQKILESWLHQLEQQRPNKELRFVLVIKAE